MRAIEIVPNLWFDTQAEEAAAFYVSVFGGRVTGTTRYTAAGPREAGTVMTVDFVLGDGQRFTAINGGPQFPHTEAVSFLVERDTQEEVDALWDALLAGGGQEGPCGWLKDRFGVSWQVVPRGFDELFAEDADPERARRAAEAMFGMRKLDVAALRAAAEGAAV
jgi:predicted 3-demethylubiquinone-9 3-methyltransferase (glyoxalase superfamily)